MVDTFLGLRRVSLKINELGILMVQSDIHKAEMRPKVL